MRLAENAKVEHLWIAADIGEFVSENGARNQLEGGAIQATSIALLEEARFASDLDETADWEHYPILKFSEVPQVTLALMPSQDQPSQGAGEAASAPVVAAIASAIYQVIGTPMRSLPFKPETIASAIHHSN